MAGSAGVKGVLQRKSLPLTLQEIRVSEQCHLLEVKTFISGVPETESSLAISASGVLSAQMGFVAFTP